MIHIAPQLMHPLLAHFPIVLLIALAVSDHAAVFSGRNLGRRGGLSSLWALLAVLAGIAAMLAYVNGTVAFRFAVEHGTAPSLMELHRDLGTVLAILALIWSAVRGWLWSRNVPLARMWNVLIAAASLGLAELVFITGLYGLSLVYGHGVGVVMPNA